MTAPAPLTAVSCGCNAGCCCVHHADIPNGRPVAACRYHASLPYAPLDRCFRWDARTRTYARVPVPRAPYIVSSSK